MSVVCFEIRTRLVFTPDGDQDLEVDIVDGTGEPTAPPMHEVLGVLEMTKDVVREEWSGAGE